MWYSESPSSFQSKASLAPAGNGEGLPWDLIRSRRTVCHPWVPIRAVEDATRGPPWRSIGDVDLVWSWVRTKPEVRRLNDVMQRVAAISDDIACRGLLVHYESQSAHDFYLHLIPEFDASPTDELHLVLLLKDIRRTLRGGRS